jgi:hypothetical protein
LENDCKQITVMLENLIYEIEQIEFKLEGKWKYM